jgi:uncharacterized RDD family membrane protein YckC
VSSGDSFCEACGSPLDGGNATAVGAPATFGQRLAARLIDGIVVIAFQALFVLPAFLPGAPSPSPVLLLVMSWIAVLLYLVVCNGSASGQTLGRRAAGIRLRRHADLQRAGYARALWRQIVGGVADSVLLLSSLSMLWDRERRTWHDRASGTSVVQGLPGPGPASALLVTAVLVLLAGAGTAATMSRVHLANPVAAMFARKSAAPFTTYAPYVATPTFSTVPDGPNLTGRSMPHVVTFTESAEGGYRYEVSVFLGDPSQVVQGLQVASSLVGSACTVDRETDAVVPAQIRVVNATTGFTAKPAVRLAAQGAEIESYHTAGPVCETEAGTVWIQGVASGERAASYFALVVHDYYVPDHPSGDPSVLADITLSAVAGADGDGRSLTLSQPMGPGVAMEFGRVVMNVADVLGGSAPTT